MTVRNPCNSKHSKASILFPAKISITYGNDLWANITLLRYIHVLIVALPICQYCQFWILLIQKKCRYTNISDTHTGISPILEQIELFSVLGHHAPVRLYSPISTFS